MIHLGLNPAALSGANVGVYAACSISEGDAIKSLDKPAVKQPLGLLGTNKAMIANRISFAFNFIGK